ncbi:MAG: hypothetical protein ABTQ32_14255 [Myxococcaceae bacterium]
MTAEGARDDRLCLLPRSAALDGFDVLGGRAQVRLDDGLDVTAALVRAPA